jgi:myo-inositol-1(or 4)-monophosphatase
MPNHSPRLLAMIEAARDAGEGLKQDFARLSSLQIETKSGLDDMFTVADLRAEATVRRHLAALEPSFGFLGEEGGLVPGSDPSHVWIVDPLDGTTNFLCGLPLFAVNIGLARDGEVIAGVTYAPMLDETFCAELGSGAFLNDEPIRVSNREGMIHAVLGVGIPFASKVNHEQFYAEMERLTHEVSGIRRLGAGALDMAYVACGRFDAYWEQSVSAWDMAAGVIIVREAGGLVTNTLGGQLDLMGGTVLAATPQIQAELLNALRPIPAAAS